MYIFPLWTPTIPYPSHSRKHLFVVFSHRVLTPSLPFVGTTTVVLFFARTEAVQLCYVVSVPYLCIYTLFMYLYLIYVFVTVGVSILHAVAFA